MQPDAVRLQSAGTGSDAPEDHGQSRLPAVDRAMSLLELLANSESGLTLSELSRMLHMPKSSTHYLINTLEARGYLQRMGKGRHSLGMRLANVANVNPAEKWLAEITVPFLRKTSGKLNLTAIVGVLKGAEAVIIGNALVNDDAGGGAWVGHHVDLHCTAMGKALIADLSDGELNYLFGGRELSSYTPRTLSLLPALKSHLAEVRASGYSVNNEEHVYGIRAVAAPVMNSGGRIVAAICVRGTTRQIPNSSISQVGNELIRISREVTARLSAY